MVRRQAKKVIYSYVFSRLPRNTVLVMYFPGLVALLLFVHGVTSQSTTCDGTVCGQNAVYCWDDIVEQWDCQCQAGFQNSHPYEVNCTDIDECHKESLHNCRDNTYCDNAEGYYTCHCQDGFNQLRLGTGFWRCADIDECLLTDTNNCRNGTVCVNSPGAFRCSCRAGFRDARISEGQYICTDIDECSGGLNSCGERSRCENTPGSFHCACLQGYQPSDQGLKTNSTTQNCADIDECNEQTCGNNSLCVNTDGSFLCQCVDGFVDLTTDGENCLSDLHMRVGIGVGVALLLLTGFILIAYLVGSDRKRCKKEIQNFSFHFKRQHNVSADTDLPIYEDVGPPLTSVSATVDRRSMRSTHSVASRELDRRSLLTHSLVNREFKEALYAASDRSQKGYQQSELGENVPVDKSFEPVYSNTMERARKARPKVIQTCMPSEDLYYSSVYQSSAGDEKGKGNVYTNFDENQASDRKEHYLKNYFRAIETPSPNPPIPGVAVQKRKPKRHVITRNSQRVWVSRIYTESEIVALSKTDDTDSNPPGYNTYRRLFFEHDETKKDVQDPEDDLAEGTLLRCGGKLYILERDACENDTALPSRSPFMKQYRSLADEAL